MRQISATIKQIHFQSPIVFSLFFLSLLMLSFVLFLTDANIFDDIKKLIKHSYMFLLISSVFGMALGKNFRALTITYLWKVNPEYRRVIYLSVLSILIIAFMIDLPLVLNHGIHGLLITLLSITIILIFIFVNGSNHSLVSIYVIYVAFYNNDFGLSSVQILLVLLGINIMLILLNYLEYKALKSGNKLKLKETWTNKILGFGLNKNRIQNKRKSIDLAMAMPGTYMGINTAYFAILSMVFIVTFNYFIDNFTSESILLITMFFINYMNLLQARKSLPQVQSMAHLFSGAHHSGIKSRIINSTDKIILINNLAFIGITLLLMKLFNVNVDYSYLVASMFMMLIIVLNSYLFVFASEMGLSLELFLITIFSYLLVMTIATYFIKNNIELITTWPAIILIIVIAMFSRKFSQKSFDKLSFERLMKIK